MSPHYKKQVKRPIADRDFAQQFNNGHYAKQDHRGFLSFLWYTGCRLQEALNMRHGDFTLSNAYLYAHITRLKGSKDVPDVALPRLDPLTSEIVNCIWFDKEVHPNPSKNRVWAYCRTTGYNIVKRVFPDYYPHYFRMSRITNLLRDHSAQDVLQMMGITATTLDHYMAYLPSEQLGKTLESRAKKRLAGENI